MSSVKAKLELPSSFSGERVRFAARVPSREDGALFASLKRAELEAEKQLFFNLLNKADLSANFLKQLERKPQYTSKTAFFRSASGNKLPHKAEPLQILLP